MKRFSLLSIGISAALLFPTLGCEVDMEDDQTPDVDVVEPAPSPDVDVERKEEIDVERKEIDADIEPRDVEPSTDIDIETERTDADGPDLDLTLPEVSDQEAGPPEEN